MSERLGVVPFGTEPPPTSAYERYQSACARVAAGSKRRSCVPQCPPANHTWSTSVTTGRGCFFGSVLGGFHMFERKRARCSSSATAWRNVRTLALLAVYGSAFARTTPTELTVSLWFKLEKGGRGRGPGLGQGTYHTPTNSMMTLRDSFSLRNAAECVHVSFSLERERLESGPDLVPTPRGQKADLVHHRAEAKGTGSVQSTGKISVGDDDVRACGVCATRKAE